MQGLFYSPETQSQFVGVYWSGIYFLSLHRIRYRFKFPELDKYGNNKQDLSLSAYLCMVISFCACRSILMSLTTTLKLRSGIRYLFIYFVSVEPNCSACLIMEFFLLILYAEAAWLSTIKEACISCELPGASVWSSTWRLASSLSASLFCKWWGGGGEGGVTCCRDSNVPGFCLAQQQSPTESIFLHPLRPPPPPPLQLLHLSEHAMPRLNYGSLLQESEPGYCFMCRFIRDLETTAKGLLRMEKVHFCDATSWNVV